MKLKPCPFCRSKSYVGRANDGFYVVCSKDTCTARITKAYPTQEQADKAWNTRVDTLDEILGMRKGKDSMRLCCFHCGKPVSTEVPNHTILRATCTCPECENRFYLTGKGEDYLRKEK